MKAALALSLCVACSAPLRDTSTQVFCACVQPDGGLSPLSWQAPVYLTCVTGDEAARKCPALLLGVPQDAGFQPNYGCTPNPSVCHCERSYDPDCPDTEG